MPTTQDRHMAMKGRISTLPLFDAIVEGNVDRVRSLISDGLDVNAQDSRYIGAPIHLAAARNESEIVRLLIAAGADCNATSSEGYTAFLYCFFPNFSPRADVAEILIEAGADVNAKREAGSAPLHLAVQWGLSDLVRLLIERGADPNARGHYGKRPIHCAITGKEVNINIAHYLIENGADVNASANWGHTPLHHAVAGAKTDVVALLLEKGADANALAAWQHKHIYTRDHHYDIYRLQSALEGYPYMRIPGITPLELAIELGNTEIVQLINRHEHGT